MKKIMFVCTGNICRSAMAEIFLKKLAEENDKELEISSCGTFAANGDGSTDEAVELMKVDYDLDLSKHRATNIQNSDIDKSDLVLCATNNHKLFVLNMFPSLKGKVFTIKEYAADGQTDDLDVSDPWGYGMLVYRRCASEIYELLQKIIIKL